VGRGDEDEEEVCGICQSAFEGTPPGVKYPGDEAPVVFGVCGHAFHLQCVATWLNSSRQTCPICRADWEYGNSDQSNNRSGGGVGNNQRS
jgi:anaphase-promoting complex subunit 11